MQAGNKHVIQFFRCFCSQLTAKPTNPAKPARGIDPKPLTPNSVCASGMARMRGINFCPAQALCLIWRRFIQHSPAQKHTRCEWCADQVLLFSSFSSAHANGVISTLKESCPSPSLSRLLLHLLGKSYDWAYS